MATIEKCSRIPPGIRAHLIERMHERGVKGEDLNRLRLWIECSPEVPAGPWAKTSVALSCAVKAFTQKHFCHRGKSRVGRSC